MKRIAIFIDGSNLYHSLVDLLGHAKLDYGKFVQKLSQGHEVYRTYYYNVQLNQQVDPDAYRSQQRFHSYLRNLPFFELRLGEFRGQNTYFLASEPEVIRIVRTIAVTPLKTRAVSRLCLPIRLLGRDGRHSWARVETAKTGTRLVGDLSPLVSIAEQNGIARKIYATSRKKITP